MPPRRSPFSFANVALIVLSLAVVGAAVAAWRAMHAPYRAGPFPPAIPASEHPRLVAGSDDRAKPMKHYLDAVGDAAGRLHVAWRRVEDESRRSSVHEVVYVRSGDGGRTWSTPRVFAERGAPRLAVRGDTVVLLTLGEGAVLFRSPDAGISWSGPEIHFRSPPEERNRVALLDATPGLFFVDHAVAWHGGRLSLVAAVVSATTLPVRIGSRYWAPGAEPIRISERPIQLVALRSDDAGRTWSEPSPLGSYHRDFYRPATEGWMSIAADPNGEGLLAAWHETGENDGRVLMKGTRREALHVTRSDDGGQTWSPASALPLAFPADRAGRASADPYLVPFSPSFAWTDRGPRLAFNTDAGLMLASPAPGVQEASWPVRSVPDSSAEPPVAWGRGVATAAGERTVVAWSDTRLARREWPYAIPDDAPTPLLILAGFAMMGVDMSLDAHTYVVLLGDGGATEPVLISPETWASSVQQLVQAGGATYALWKGGPSRPWADRHQPVDPRRGEAFYVTPLPAPDAPSVRGGAEETLY